MDLLNSPVFYGINDVQIPTKQDGQQVQYRNARILYPSFDGSPQNAAIIDPAGPREIYPLVAFVHGDRNSSQGEPADTSKDYLLWEPVLHLLARCGMVVVSADYMDVVGNDDPAAGALEQVIKWMYLSWAHRDVFSTDVPEAALPDRPPKSNLAVVGHSWGARACARYASRSRVRCAAYIAGSWEGGLNDLERGYADVEASNTPTLILSGVGDAIAPRDKQNSAYLRVKTLKHQVSIQGIAHYSYTPIKNADLVSIETCGMAAEITRELLTVFLSRYLENAWWKINPALSIDPGGRYPLIPLWDESCAFKVRWNDPTWNKGPAGPVGELTVGNWAETSPW